jgi:hypothetical protein
LNSLPERQSHIAILAIGIPSIVSEIFFRFETLGRRVIAALERPPVVFELPSASSPRLIWLDRQFIRGGPASQILG